MPGDASLQRGSHTTTTSEIEAESGEVGSRSVRGMKPITGSLTAARHQGL